WTSMPFRRCCSGERAISRSRSVTSSLTKYGIPHAEYDVYGPRSKATISSSSGSRRRRAREAAVMPAASPPMTTSRSVTRWRGSRGCWRPQAAERLDHSLGFGHEPPHELAGGDEVLDGAGALPGRVALAFGIDVGRLAAREVQRAFLDRLEDLFRERPEVLSAPLPLLRAPVP